MFWRMTGLSTTSPVETILDRENFTLEELLDEDEIIQECKALNGRLINFLRGRTQVEQLIRYIVEEAQDDTEQSRTFKFPFIACEIFTCDVDIILKTLVEDEELMNLLFSFLEMEHSHNTLLAGYFSKVVICLLLRKTIPCMHYIKAHQQVLSQLVNLIGITSIMEVLIRIIGADEHMYANYTDAMQWIEDTDILEMIVDKFSSSDSPEVHSNAAETLCAITRFAPPGLAAKISSPDFIGRLFQHALEESRPKSVLVNSLSICISLLDPRRQALGPYYSFNRQLSFESTTTASPETVDGMLQNLGDLFKLLDPSLADGILLTTYGKLQPPLGKHRLKIVEFISVLLTVGGEAAETKLIELGAVQKILDLFFEYPYNNFLHHHVENILTSCLESKNTSLVDHLLRDCNIVGRILNAEKNPTVDADASKPTSHADGRAPPRIGNIGHLTHVSNKLINLAKNNNDIQTHLQESNDWIDWYTDTLKKRNAVENVHQWVCGRPTSLHDRRDSDDDDSQDRDYDVAALANNLSQAFQYSIHGNEDIDEDVYFDDDSAEVVISSLRLGENQEGGSLFSNSNWFAFKDDSHRVEDEQSSGELTSSSPDNEGTHVDDGEVSRGEGDTLDDTATSPELGPSPDDNTCDSQLEEVKDLEASANEKPPFWVEWRETSDSGAPLGSNIPNGELQVDPKEGGDISDATKPHPSPVSETDVDGTGRQPESTSPGPAVPVEFGGVTPSSETSEPTADTVKLTSESEGASAAGIEDEQTDLNMGIEGALEVAGDDQKDLTIVTEKAPEDTGTTEAEESPEESEVEHKDPNTGTEVASEVVKDEPKSGTEQSPEVGKDEDDGIARKANN